MRNLILFLVKYGGFLLFIVYQLFCFYLIVNYNQKQGDIYLNSSNLFAGYLNQKTGQWNNYFKLDQENEKLRRENAALLKTIINDGVKTVPLRNDTIDTLYAIIPSTICSKTIHLRNNYITLCHGEDRNFKKGMGVINRKGLVGIIQQVSPHYSKVLSVFHSESRISVALKGKNHHGNMYWDTYDSRFATVHNIRKHADLAIGDTIVTSGYSMVFPADIIVGTIKNYDLKSGGDSYEIEIALSANYEEIDNVFVINHLLKQEFEELKIEGDE